MRKKLMTGFLTAVMALSLVPAMPTVNTYAANAIVYNKTTPTKVLNNKKIYIYVGGKRVNLDYNIAGKKSGVKGTWSSSDKTVATVNKYGIVKAVGNGDAVITFKYKNGSKYKTLKVNVNARTRAASVALNANPATHNVIPGTKLTFTSTLTPNANAAKIDPDIQSTYTVYYNVYSDMACTNAVSDGSITFSTASGTTTEVAAAKAGTYYIVATAKNSPNALKYNVRSTPYQLVVAEDTAVSVKQSNVNQITVTSNKPIKNAIMTTTANAEVAQASQTFSADRMTEIITLKSNVIGQYNVTVDTDEGTKQTTVTCEAQKVNAIKVNNTTANKVAGSTTGSAKAYVYYSVFDQFGNNITTSSAIDVNNYIIPFYEGVVQKKNGSGVIELSLSEKQAIKGSKGTLQIKYIPANGTTITDTETITIGDVATLKTLSIAGIYKCTNVSNKISYSCVLSDSVSGLDMSSLSTATASYTATDKKYDNALNNGYYVLVNAKDTNGADVTDPSTIEVNVISTGDLSGKITVLNDSSKLGIVTINNNEYIAYPLQISSGITYTQESTIEIQAIAGTSNFVRIKKTIPKEIALGHIIITTQTVDYDRLASTSLVPLNADFYDTTGSKITSYATMEKLLTNNGTMNYSLDNYISSNYGSFFIGVASDGVTPILRFAPNDSKYTIGQSTMTDWTSADKTDNNKVYSGIFYLTRKN